MKELVFASNNANKLRELRELLDGKYMVLSLSDIGCHDDIPEESDSFEGNALGKALWVKERYGYDCFADDSGLEVFALGGEPGIYSARYAGCDHDSAANNAKLLERLENINDRRARFRTAIALVCGDKQPIFFNGYVDGEILNEEHGAGGFGYDPLFRPDGWDKTFAEASPEEKNAVSHRGMAVRKLVAYLEAK